MSTPLERLKERLAGFLPDGDEKPPPPITPTPVRKRGSGVPPLVPVRADATRVAPLPGTDPKARRTEAYKPGLSELVYRAVDPTGYPDGLGSTAKRVARNLLDHSDRSFPGDPQSEDAWRLYLGLPQANGTFHRSEHRPSRSTDPGATYYRRNGFLEGASNHGMVVVGSGPHKRELSFRAGDPASFIRTVVQNLQNQRGRQAVVEGDASFVFDMANFTAGLGQDERGSYLSYFDKWDLDVPGERNGGLVGKPFEIYDRIYYDPQTFQPVQPLPPRIPGVRPMDPRKPK